MTSSRLIKALLGVTGILAILVWVHFFQLRSRSQTPFLHTVDAAQKITLQIGASKIELQRDGSSWWVQTNSGSERYKADSGVKVAALITQLKGLQVEDEIADRPDRAAEYEVDTASGALVTLYDGNGRPLAEGIFGKQAQDFTHIYFRFPNQPNVYLARGAVRREVGETNVNGWRDHTLLDVPEDQVEAVFIETPGFKTPLVRSSNTWSSNGKTVDPTPVWGMIGVLAHLKADEFVDPSQHPELTADKLQYASVTLQMQGGGAHELHVGRIDPTAQRYPVSVDKEPSVGWIQENTAKLFLRKLSDFLKK